MEGHHFYDGDSHGEDYTFTGTFDRASGRLQGTLTGQITVGGVPDPYEGEWQGQMAPGERVVTGTYRGWFLKDKPDGAERPIEEKEIYKGQWGLLEEDSLRLGDPYIARTRAWLELVWTSRNTEDYPWLLPV